MRILVILSVAICLGCAHQQTASTPPTKTPYVQPNPKPRAAKPEQANERAKPQPGPAVETQCRAQPPGGCNSMRTRAECMEHLRCSWVRRGAGYCRRLPCQDG